MVTSGLFSGLDVSPARLAIHLGLALTILAFAFWLALGAFGWPRALSRLGAPVWAPFALMALIFTQAMFGALLAGARGGPAYADWPTIGHQWIPSSAFALEPFWRNFIANHATQHLMHRTLGYVVALCALALAFAAARGGQGRAGQAALALGGLALAQAGLGIATVMMATPLPLALIHQLTAALLWLCTVAVARATVYDYR
jgi:heme a synthase